MLEGGGIRMGGSHQPGLQFTYALSSSPQAFWHQEPVSWKTVLPRKGLVGGVVIQVITGGMGNGRCRRGWGPVP